MYTEEALKSRHSWARTKCSDFSGCKAHKHGIWGSSSKKCYRGVLISMVLLYLYTVASYPHLITGRNFMKCVGTRLLQYSSYIRTIHVCLFCQNSIDLVVAVNPDAEDRTDLNMYEPKTMWPLPE